MFAIRAAFGIPSGTTYVRALTLLNILITVVIIVLSSGASMK